MSRLAYPFAFLATYLIVACQHQTPATSAEYEEAPLSEPRLNERLHKLCGEFDEDMPLLAKRTPIGQFGVLGFLYEVEVKGDLHLATCRFQPNATCRDNRCIDFGSCCDLGPFK